MHPAIVPVDFVLSRQQLMGLIPAFQDSVNHAVAANADVYWLCGRIGGELIPAHRGHAYTAA